jgi:glycoside/pentoside/hexuronide:cation symporter, GPH family
LKQRFNGQDEKLPFWVKFGYGGAEGSGTLVWSAFYIFFLFFCTDVVGLSPATAGFIMLVATIWDAVTDPLVGIWSDGIKWRYGRRRPFLLATALPYGLATWLLFSDFGFGRGWEVAYFLGAVILFFTLFTLLNVPYTALAAEMTQDYDERNALAAFRVGWSQLFTILAAGLTLVLAGVFEDLLGSETAGWSAMAACFGFVAIWPILLTWRVTRGRELFPEDVRLKPRDIWQAALKNRSFLYTMGIYAAGAAAVNIAAAVMVYYAKYNMGMSDERSSIVFLVLFLATLLWVPVIAVSMSRYGKRWAYIIFASFWAVCQGVGILFVKPGREALLYVLIVFAAAGVAAVPFVGWSMVPDVVEVDELKTGMRREGMYTGITTFVQKAAGAVVLQVTGLVLSWVGYVADAKQTPTALTGIRLLFCYILPMTKQRHEAVRDAISLKKAGKPYSGDVLDGL